MKEPLIDNNISIPSDHQAAEISQPRKRPFHFPPSPIPPKFPAIVMLALFVVLTVRTNHLDAASPQPFTQRITVIPFVGNDPLWILSRPTATPPGHGDVLNGFLQQCYLARRGRVQVVSQRNTLAVDHHHPLRALASLGLSDAAPPFFAGAKLPSAKASLQSSCPFSSNWARKTRQIFSQTPCSSHCLSRRQQVEALGNRSGSSLQGAPVYNIQSKPSKTSRWSRQGRPPRRDGLTAGKSGWIFCHCSSVSFQRVFFRVIEKTPFDDRCIINRWRAQVLSLNKNRL